MNKKIGKILKRFKPGANGARPASINANDAEGFAAEIARRDGARVTERLRKDSERNIHLRSEERTEFSVIAELVAPDRGIATDGVISEASRGGLTFRPATNYIENRTGERIQIVIEGLKRMGIIRSTRANGYGVQLLEPLSPEDLDLLREISVDITPLEAV